MRAGLAVLAGAVAWVLLAAGVPAVAGGIEPLPNRVDAWDYQLGGARRVPDRVDVVVRDRRAEPVSGAYSVCYVNGFQTQPDEKRFWRDHWRLVLERGGEPVVDGVWGEWLLDLRTPAKRRALARIVGRWTDRCADDGFAAVEYDNLDSFTRSRGLLTAADARAYASRLVSRAHDSGLAAAQKNRAQGTARSSTTTSRSPSSAPSTTSAATTWTPTATVCSPSSTGVVRSAAGAASGATSSRCCAATSRCRPTARVAGAPPERPLDPAWSAPRPFTRRGGPYQACPDLASKSCPAPAAKISSRPGHEEDDVASGVETGRITTDIPARMDRLPWSRFHWLIVVGLGTVWILDGLEVTIVGSMSDALADPKTGLGLDSFDVGFAGAIYVAGACIGALFFGQLTDRFGRKKLFLITLAVYTVATVLTAFSMNPTWYFACRFFTGAGIGGEYAAINSAIDELIPKKYRGRVDVSINGSFWIGAAGGALLTIPLLDPTLVNQEWGWRLAFGLGAILAVGILIVRRHVPESPRWLFIHGREEEGERIVREIEGRVSEETGRELESVSETITIRQRKTIGIGLIARTVFTMYPKRTTLCLSLFIGQAFLYNAFFFTYGDTLGEFMGVTQVGYYIAVFAISNFIGALVLGPLFDSIGRVKMLTGTYVISGVLLAITGLTLDSYTAVTLTLMGCIVFFFASAGASAAYLTASEVFPMETRALCIAFFYAVGTAAGGIAGPLLFGKLIQQAVDGGEGIAAIALGYYIGAALMVAGGIVAAFLGVKAEGQSLESIARPLTAEDDDAGPTASGRDEHQPQPAR